MYRFVLLETLTTLPLPFHPLCWSKSVLLRPENYLEFSRFFFLTANQIVSETLNVMLLFSQTSEFKPITKRFWESTRFIHFDGVRITNIHSRRNQAQLSLIMTSVAYRNVVTDFCSREGISCLNSGINDSRDCSPFL